MSMIKIVGGTILLDEEDIKFNSLIKALNEKAAALAAQPRMRKKLRELVADVKWHNAKLSVDIQDLIEILDTVNNAFISPNEKIPELIELANTTSGKPSAKSKKLGATLMAIGVLFIATAVLLITLGAVGIVPSFGVSIFIGLFGMAPFMTGIGFFKKGHALYKSGQRQGLSKKIHSIAKSANLGLFKRPPTKSAVNVAAPVWRKGVVLRG